ncbi:MAG: UbiA family prenyltransferase [Candidatus Aenigmarchaeota archaeon]|nr:UbiA family prenyltransferase [Candidatus Aenigmarchaeota archaeon]
MLDYLRIIRPLNCLMAAAAVYIGSLVSGSLLPTQNMLYGMLSVFFICGAGMIANDYFDISIDRINKPKRPLASGSVSKHFAILYAALLFFVGNFLAFAVGEAASYVALAASLMLIAYAARLKKTLVIGHFIVSLLVGLAFVYGGIISGSYLAAAILGLLALLSNMGREIFKSIEDVDGDRRNGVKSLPLKIGEKPAKIVASSFIFFAVVLSLLPFISGILGMSYLLTVFIADVMFIATLFRNGGQAKLCKAAMLVAMAAFLIGALVKF